MNTLNALIAHSNSGLNSMSWYSKDYILKFLFLVKDVASNGYHTIILTKDGTVFACGKNSHGQLGLGDKKQRNTFTKVTLPGGVVAKQVIAGEDHSMILTEDGTVFACGGNYLGQLGLGDTKDRNTFTEVTLPEGVVVAQIVAGKDHSMILTEDGTVFACGCNGHGQLGLRYSNQSNTFYSNTFTAVSALPDGKVVKQIAAGATYTIILAKDGTMFSCGNVSGRHRSETLTAVPALPDGQVAAQLVAGRDHAMIISEDGRVFASSSSAIPRSGAPPPRCLPSGNIAMQLTSGKRHTTILTQDGTVFTHGSNYYGQLGLGDNDDRSTLTAMPALPEGVVIKQVVAGAYHTMIIAQDGTLFSCGKNDDGQLGLGDTENRNTFTQVLL